MKLTVEKVLLLKNIPTFADIDESALGDFIYACEEVAYPAGKELIKKGEKNDSLYILLQGFVQILDGESILSEYEAHQMFGEMTALCPDRVDVTVKAVQDTIALRISSENLYEMMSLYPDIAKRIIKVLVTRLKVLDNGQI